MIQPGINATFWAISIKWSGWGTWWQTSTTTAVGTLYSCLMIKEYQWRAFQVPLVSYSFLLEIDRDHEDLEIGVSFWDTHFYLKDWLLVTGIIANFMIWDAQIELLSYWSAIFKKALSPYSSEVLPQWWGRSNQCLVWCLVFGHWAENACWSSSSFKSWDQTRIWDDLSLSSQIFLHKCLMPFVCFLFFCCHLVIV